MTRARPRATPGAETFPLSKEPLPVLRPLVFAVLLSVGAAPAAATTISFQNGFDGYSGADNQSFSFDGMVGQDRIRLDLLNPSQLECCPHGRPPEPRPAA